MSEPTIDHTVTAYEDELKALDASVVAMGDLALAQVRKAVACIDGQEETVAQTVIELDGALDQMEAEIEGRVTRLIARRQPMADDLRNALATVKIAIDLERCGDLGKNIAKRALVTGALDDGQLARASVARMGELVVQRLEQVMTAYAARDVEAAREVWRRDEDIDQQYESIFRELLTYMMADARMITPCAHLLFVAKNLERIGDHATNIAEDLLYWLTGDNSFGGARPKRDALAPVTS